VIAVEQLDPEFTLELGDPLVGRLLTYDALDQSFRTFKVRRDPSCPACGDVVRQVSFAESSLQYCATCQTGGKPLADRRMSRLLR